MYDCCFVYGNDANGIGFIITQGFKEFALIINNVPGGHILRAPELLLEHSLLF